MTCEIPRGNLEGTHPNWKQKILLNNFFLRMVSVILGSSYWCINKCSMSVWFHFNYLFDTIKGGETYKLRVVLCLWMKPVQLLHFLVTIVLILAKNDAIKKKRQHLYPGYFGYIFAQYEKVATSLPSLRQWNSTTGRTWFKQHNF